VTLVPKTKTTLFKIKMADFLTENTRYAEQTSKLSAQKTWKEGQASADAPISFRSPSSATHALNPERPHRAYLPVSRLFPPIETIFS
jgi:hypothetical protein